MRHHPQQYLYVIVGAFLMVGATTTNAALIDHGSYTTDPISGLDWLDLTATRGLSYDDVSAQMGAGQQFEGWRFANRAVVNQFWINAGGTGPFTGLASGATNWVGQLQSLWGKTYPFVYTVNGYNVQGSIAMTHDPSPTCMTCNLTVYLLDNIDVSDSSLGDYAEIIQLNEAYRWQGQIPIGHALMRDTAAPIPEPATLPMFAVGLAAAIAFARRRRTPYKICGIAFHAAHQ
jgi:hypothetical protein